MSEADFLLFHNMAAQAEALVCGACMAAFFCRFMPASRKGRGKREILWAVFLIYTGVYSANLWDLVSVNGWTCMLAAVALMEIVLGWEGWGRGEVFLLSALFFSIRYLSLMIVDSPHYLLDQAVMEGAADPETVFWYAALTYSVILCGRLVLLALMLYAAGRCLPPGRGTLGGRELCYLCLMPMGGILYGNIITRLYMVVKEDAYFRMYEQYPAFLGMVPLVALLFYAGSLAALVSYREMAGLQEERRRHFVEEQQMNALRERMEEVASFYDGMGRVKHEMRNHLTNIRGLAVKGDYQEMERYIMRISDSLDAFEFTVRTGNAVTDVIVNDKRKAAQKAGVRFGAEFAYPASEGYDPYDVGVILHNLLQNALEACERMERGEKYILLSGRRKKRFFLIEVRNSFEGEVAFDGDTGLPVSVKGKEPFLHGMGLSNVKREALKYMGDVDIRAEGKEFCVTVLLQEGLPGKGC